MFYILELITKKIFSFFNVNSVLNLRILPCAFGIIFIAFIFKLFNGFKMIKLKSEDFEFKKALIPLFALFFASINTVNIYHSQEARCYSMCMALSCAIIYYLFKIIKNPDFKTNFKSYLKYGILGAFIINTHFYMTLFLISNFIFGSFKIIKNQRGLKSFFVLNLIIFLTFLPYLIYTFKISASNTFNSWIEAVNLNTYFYIIKEYFSNYYIFGIILTIVIIYLVLILLSDLNKLKLPINKGRKELFLYLIFTILFILLSATVVSSVLKPILHKRLLISCYTLLFLLETILILGIFEFKTKRAQFIKIVYQVVLFFMLIFTIKPMPLREIYVMDDFMAFVLKDSKQYERAYEIHAVSNDTEEYLQNYPEILENENIIWHFVDTNSLEYLKKISKNDFSKKKNVVIYVQNMTADIDSVSFLNPKARVFYTNSIKNAKIIYK